MYNLGPKLDFVENDNNDYLKLAKIEELRNLNLDEEILNLDEETLKLVNGSISAIQDLIDLEKLDLEYIEEILNNRVTIIKRALKSETISTKIKDKVLTMFIYKIDTNYSIKYIEKDIISFIENRRVGYEGWSKDDFIELYSVLFGKEYDKDYKVQM